MKSIVVTKFYHFHQNNSGGSFDGPAINVIVEAINAAHANTIAEEHGLYFDGCDKGIDCGCCGDRWSEQWSDDKGTDAPKIYGKNIEEHLTSGYVWGNDRIPEVTVYYLDGRENKYYV